jgi:hypothetical protein
VPRRGFAPRPSVFLLSTYSQDLRSRVNTLFTRALQRAGRLAAYCSNPHTGGGRFALATPPDRTLSPPRHIAEVRTSPPQNGKYAAARVRKSLTHAAEPAGPTRAAGGGIRLQCSGFHKRVARPSLSSARRKNSPTARSPASRLRFAG